MLDTIQEQWTKFGRIGFNKPALDRSVFKEMEDYIRDHASNKGYEPKFNVGAQAGGVPPRRDRKPIVTTEIPGIAYHDVIGGIMVSVRNAELNCRILDRVVNEDAPETELTSKVISKLGDKYILRKEEQENIKPSEILFLTGTNAFDMMDWDKIEEICVDYPNAMIKPHPITTEAGEFTLHERFPNKVFRSTEAAYELLSNSNQVWVTYNSELGLMAALLRKPFGSISKWSAIGRATYAQFYRQFEYKNLEHNYGVVRKVIESKNSGLVFPWQEDWKERVDAFFDCHVDTYEKGMTYPYRSK